MEIAEALKNLVSVVKSLPNSALAAEAICNAEIVLAEHGVDTENFLAYCPGCGKSEHVRTDGSGLYRCYGCGAEWQKGSNNAFYF